MLGLGGAFVLVMLGTRMSTLSFGQVFSVHREEDVKRIAQLEAENESLRTENRRLSNEAGKVPVLESTNEALTAEADVWKAKAQEVQVVEKPVYVPQPVDTSEPVGMAEKPTRKKGKASAASSWVVHRGDGPDVVRRVLGKPTSVEQVGDAEWWYFEDSLVKKIVFRNGAVAEWEGMPVEP